jgi:dTDP-4-amino-4,6-dideoxygalactose transaminase
MQDYLQREYRKVDRFERELSRYTGAPFVACVDSCTSALLLCFLYNNSSYVVLPKNTYIGVAQAALNAHKRIEFKDIKWRGLYQILPTNIYDAAKRFTSNMYIPGSHMCLSFHYKKHINIGKGGAILTDSKDAYEWFCKARNNGKNISLPMWKQVYTTRGYNMILHPLLAQKGLNKLRVISLTNEDLPEEHYGDLSVQMKPLLDQPVIK